MLPKLERAESTTGGHVPPASTELHTTSSAKVAFEHPEKVGHPDGIPHDVVGMLMFGIVMLVAVTVISYVAVGVVAAVVAAVVLSALLLRWLSRRSQRERKEEAVEAVRSHHDPHPLP